MTRKNFIKRIVSGFVSAAIAMTSLPIIPIFAETGTNSYSFDGYNVEYSVKNEWSDGQAIEVKITNTGDEPILNWAFKYNAQGEISDLWNASVYDAKETSYVIKNAGWNYEIAPDASVSFGYTLSDYSGTNPEQFELCAKRVDKTDGYDVQYNITNEWDTGLQGEIIITNTSEEPLEAWELSFDSTFEINNLWDGRIISSEENHYVVASEMWSNPINAGESKIIGFTGTKQNADESAISSFNLSVVVIDSDVNNGGNGGNTGNDPNPNPEIDVTTDTDSDKIPDAYEEIFGTDKNKPDTDDDGLTDYEEIALTGTDPLVYDSVTEGISDADADCDEDGLTNKEELKLGTSPTYADTDFDGLSDYDEINVYNTDPLNPDTDEDGINDGDEIKLELDPNSDTTDGIKDIERVTHQIIDSDSDILSRMNGEDNPLKISVEIDAAGLADSCLTIDESRYSNIVENSAVVGVIPEFEYANGLKVENMTIKFEVDETARANKIGSYAKECAELEGIKRLNVFEYFDDIGVLLPIETHHDIENNIVYAETNKMGTYCVLDMEIWMQNLGIEPISTEEPTEELHANSAVSTLSAVPYDALSDDGRSSVDEKIDLALCLDTRTCVSSTEFAKMKQAIKHIVDLSYGNKLNIGDIYLNYQDKSGYHKKLITKSNLSDLDGITRSIDVYYKENNTKVYYFDLTAMLEYTYNNISDRDNVIFLITNRDDIVVQNALVNKLKSVAKANADRVHVVLMGDNMYAGAGEYFDMFIGATNGLLRSSLDEYTVGDVLQNYLEPTDYTVRLANSFEEIELKGMLRKSSDIDTDEDGLSDWKEVNFDIVNLFNNNPSRTYCFNSQFPTIQDFIDYESTRYPRVSIFLERFFSNNEEMFEIPLMPITSNPTKVDSDGDGLYDGQRVIYDIANSKPVFENEISDKSLITDKTKYRIMIPIDDDLMNSSDYKDAWKSQMEAMKNGNIETEYTSGRGDANEVMNSMAENAYSLVNILMENDWIVNENFINIIEFMFKDSAQGDTAEEWGSDFLDFIFDKNEVAYHSQVETWQKAFGYNDLYDMVFEYGSKMLVNKIPFNYNNTQYILWSWKGDYWNLQSGGETGIYVYDRTVNNTKHYNVADFNMPMTLSLYKGSGSQMESIFNWAPTEDQWWITGFNPEFTNPDPYDMTMICSVDFLNDDLYEAFKENGLEYNEQIIFDNDYHTAWIMW